MINYVTSSLELHLFFVRIMKEHSFFLEAGFVGKDCSYIKRARWFRTQFEGVLNEVVQLSNGVVRPGVLASEEAVTGFTLPAEKKTSQLTGIPISSQITAKELCLRSGNGCTINRGMGNRVKCLNQKVLRLVSGLIAFKGEVLEDVATCRLYTFTYPLLIEHIMREAKLYQCFLEELEMTGTISCQNMRETEMFWNQIMMEHALFIRGLLDPSEEELIGAADGFAKDYKKLLAQVQRQDCRTMDELTGKTLQETEKYRDFKAAGTKGITECEIASVILPLLGDHVLREANHYLRILQDGKA